MKKVFLLGLLLAVAVMTAGCASAKPKIYVSESELPKTKFVIVEVNTYKEFKEDNGGWIFNAPNEEEYGKVFETAFKEKLREQGFTVVSGITTNRDANVDFLTIKVSMGNRPPPVPLMSNGYVVSSTSIYNKGGKLIYQLNGATLTSSLVTTPSHMVKVKLAPYLAETIAETFLK